MSNFGIMVQTDAWVTGNVKLSSLTSDAFARSLGAIIGLLFATFGDCLSKTQIRHLADSLTVFILWIYTRRRLTRIQSMKRAPFITREPQVVEFA